MKTAVLGGDPQSLAGMLNLLYANNPKIKVISTAVAPFIGQQQQSIQQLQPSQQVPIHVFYLTYDGPDLVNEKGEKLQ
jgi:hypothetical protein